LLLLTLFPINSFAIPVDIQDISDDKYFQAAHEALSNAKGSIYMAMYEISIEPDKPESAPYMLVQDIVDAYTRGVNVEVYLESKENASEMCLLYVRKLLDKGAFVCFNS